MIKTYDLSCGQRLSFFLRDTVKLQQVEDSWPVDTDVPAVLSA